MLSMKNVYRLTDKETDKMTDGSGRDKQGKPEAIEGHFTCDTAHRKVFANIAFFIL